MDAMTRELPRERWAPLLAELGSMNRGQRVRIEVVSEASGAQALLDRAAPLAGITIETKGPEAGAIDVALELDGAYDHRLFHPAHVYTRTNRDGLLDCVDLEEEDGTKTLISFEAPVLLPQG